MFGIAAIVAFAIALILQLASVSKGTLLNVTTFALIGLLCLAIDRGYYWYSDRRRAA
jgi:hypothetical protein